MFDNFSSKASHFVERRVYHNRFILVSGGGGGGLRKLTYTRVGHVVLLTGTPPTPSLPIPLYILYPYPSMVRLTVRVRDITIYLRTSEI